MIQTDPFKVWSVCFVVILSEFILTWTLCASLQLKGGSADTDRHYFSMNEFHQSVYSEDINAAIKSHASSIAHVHVLGVANQVDQMRLSSYDGEMAISNVTVTIF